MGRYIDTMSQAYVRQLIENSDFDRADEIALRDNVYTPILKVREAHPDSEPNPKDFNEMICDVIYDLTILNVEFSSMGYSFKELLDSTNERLKKVKKTLAMEKERQQDINILCNKYTEFSQVLDLTGDDFVGDFTENDGVFTAAVRKLNPVVLQVASIEGNGYEGNKYVYNSGSFLEEIIKTSDRKYITDNQSIPYFEYSRITASNEEKEIFPLVNFDSIEAKCSISVYSATKFNKLVIESPQKDLVLSDVSISEDGVIFKSVNKDTIEFNNTEKKYEIQDYIPGTGIICFPLTYFAKITLESKSATDDIIAFYKSEIVQE